MQASKATNGSDPGTLQGGSTRSSTYAGRQVEARKCNGNIGIVEVLLSEELVEQSMR